MMAGMGLGGDCDWRASQPFLEVMFQESGKRTTPWTGRGNNAFGTGFGGDIPVNGNCRPTQVHFVDSKITDDQNEPGEGTFRVS